MLGSDSSRVGYQQVQEAFGPGATGPLQIVPRASDAAAVTRLAQGDFGITGVLPGQSNGELPVGGLIGAGFQSQGFLDAWGPVFFLAMIFAIVRFGHA